MTASELYEIVKDWPLEAWPEGATVNSVGGRAYWWVEYLNDEGKAVSRVPVSPLLATLLFEASGMRHIMRKGYVIDMQDDENGNGFRLYYWPEIQPKFVGKFPSPLHAIAAAIKATT